MNEEKKNKKRNALHLIEHLVSGYYILLLLGFLCLAVLFGIMIYI